MLENFQKLIKKDIDCDLEKEIDEDDEKATNGVDDDDISLNVVKQYQQSEYILPTGYKKGGISARKELIFNDPEDAACDLE